MPLLVTSCIRAVKRLRSWLTSIRNCIISQNGGNNFMERAKVKTVKVFSPASVDLTTDLHSMGQWIQDGERTIFTKIGFNLLWNANRSIAYLVPTDEADLDGLNFLAGKHVDEVNKMAELGTQLAHVDGGVPNIKVTMPEVSAFYIGQLFYFFEKACGISGYMLGVNPFNQPGVEAYKKNMFALLNKPGYEKESEAIKARL